MPRHRREQHSAQHSAVHNARACLYLQQLLGALWNRPPRLPPLLQPPLLLRQQLGLPLLHIAAQPRDTGTSRACPRSARKRQQRHDANCQCLLQAQHAAEHAHPECAGSHPRPCVASPLHATPVGL